jgi:RNA polymerase sigma factor (sigma-70 family)
MPTDPWFEPENLLANAARVRVLARALVADVNEARDIEQSAWKRVLESGRVLESPQWLTAIVRNVARSRWREQTRRVEREQRVASERRPIPTPEEVLEREELRRGLVEHVLALDDPWRTTIVLHYMEERDLRDVAHAMGVSVETARTRSRRGLELLRLRMKREKGTAWSLVLIQGFDLESSPPALSATLGGIVAVGTAAKLGVLVVAGVAALATLWSLRDGAPAVPLALDAIAAEAPAFDEPRAELQKSSAALAAREEVRATTVETPVSSGTTPAGPASVRVRAVWEIGRVPAGGVWVELRCMEDRAPELQLRRARTDANGDASFNELPPGRFVARTDRGTHSTGALAPGESKSVEIVLRPGVQLAGDVVDHLGQPVAAAEIWIDDMGFDGRGFPVARSDAQGKFELRGLARGGDFAIGARASGRAPTPQHYLRAPESDEVRLRLSFAAAGDVLRVLVLDSGGEPVPDASVVLGAGRFRESASLADASHLLPAPPLRARGDSSGEARFEGAALGRTPLEVRAPDFAPWSGEVDIGRERDVVVRLERGAVLRGSVLDSDGRPVSNARISVGKPGEFAETLASSKPDGTFALHGLPAGEFRALARADQRGSAEQTFYGAPGAALEWNAQLESGGVIRGRILAPEISLSGWCVFKIGASSDSALNPDMARVAADGSFKFLDCEDAPATLQVLEGPDKVFVLATVREVRPSDEEVLIEIDPARRPSVRLRGRVVDELGKPLTDVDVSPFDFDLGPSPVEHVDAQTGRFDLGPYPSGNWGLVIVSRDRPPLRVPPRKVAPDEAHDFGDLVAVAGGVLAVSIARAPQVAGDEVEVSLQPLEGQLADGFRGRGALVRSRPLSTGRYELQVFASDGYSSSQPVEVVSGRETALEVRLEPAARWSARLLDADGRPWRGHVTWLATDSESRTLVQGFEAPADGQFSPTFALPAGAIDVLVMAQDGSRSAVFALPAELSARRSASAIVLTLR